MLTNGPALLMALLVASTLSACGSDDAPETTHPPGETSAAAPGQRTPGGATAVPPATSRHFDPAHTAVGDSFLNLRVASRSVRRVFDDSVWAGSVGFHGRITVTGEYRRHFDWPEPAALCFWVTAPASLGRLPAFAPDAWTSPNRQTWFCFTNPERAAELLGSGETPVPATVVIDEYTVVREFSDVFDGARLVDATAAAPPR